MSSSIRFKLSHQITVLGSLTVALDQGLAWDEIGLDQVDDRLGRLQAELEATETPEMRELRSAHEEAQEEFRSGLVTTRSKHGQDDKGTTFEARTRRG